MAKTMFICSEGTSNKWWGYEKSADGLTVTVEYARVGLECKKPDIKTFRSSYEADRFINSKVDEKTKKGYRLVQQEELQKEERKANNIGFRNKIDETKWVRLEDKELAEIKNYDPIHWMYVKLTDSWSNETRHFILNRQDAMELESVTHRAGGLRFARGSRPRGKAAELVEGLRRNLRDLLNEVREAVQTVQFAALGVRKLDIGGDSDEFNVLDEKVVSETVAKVSSKNSFASAGVIRAFAALGARNLEI